MTVLTLRKPTGAVVAETLVRSERAAHFVPTALPGAVAGARGGAFSRTVLVFGWTPWGRQHQDGKPYASRASETHLRAFSPGSTLSPARARTFPTSRVTVSTETQTHRGGRVALECSRRVLPLRVRVHFYLNGRKVFPQ